jgi:NAD(P)-dependent dehydrogenase (short-subunit alcohol dehydrogenase family)
VTPGAGGKVTNVSDWLGYSGKRVIVTGCHSGIGHAVARQLVVSGADVHGLDRKPCDLALGSFTQVDVRVPASIEAALPRLTGSFDALFNCAGMPPGAPPLDIMKANFLGMRLLTERILPQLRDGGAIGNVSSNGGMNWRSHLGDLLALDATPSFDDGVRWCEAHADLVAEGYRCSKEAIIVWTFASASRNIARGIRTNCTLPGAVQTPMLEEIEKTTPRAAIDVIAQPIGRRSSADEQATALLFLNSLQASYVNGAALPVDGGFMSAMSTKS